MTEPAYRYIVIRAAADLPEGFLPPDLEGRWYDLADIPSDGVDWSVGGGVAVVTDRFERREDGVTARVYEVRP